MRTICVAAVSLAYMSTTLASGTWQNVHVFQENVEKPHSTMMTYPSARTALANKVK